jgi:beta-phosphoglucomutase-like phosphatase (HAD superfamily)
MPMTQGDLVIFDNDGVLVDSEPLANQVLADLLTECGYPTTRDEAVQRYLGNPIGAVRGLVADSVGLELPPDFEQRYMEQCFAGFRATLQPIAGVAAVLDHLDELQVPYCVASSGIHDRIELTLTVVGFLDRFGGRVFSVEDVARGKPAPDLFLFAAAKSSTPPERCFVVEDSPAGVVAARAAGMRVVGYSAMTPVERLEAAGADAIVGSMDDLPGVLALLRAGRAGRRAN